MVKKKKVVSPYQEQFTPGGAEPVQIPKIVLPEPKPIVPPPTIFSGPTPVGTRGTPESRAQEDERLTRQAQAHQGLPVLGLQGALEAKQKEEELVKISGKVGQFTEEEQVKTPISQEQALKVGTAGAIPGVLSGVVGGALAGGAAGIAGGPLAPFTIPLGVVTGAAVGFFVGYKSNIASQKKGIIRGQKTNVADAEKNLMFLISLQNQGKGNAVENMELFNDGLQIIAESYSQLKLDTMDQQALFTGQDGTAQLMKFETFYASGRDRTLIMAMQNAILAPDPNNVVNFLPSFDFEDI
jgi:hypothetical protein